MPTTKNDALAPQEPSLMVQAEPVSSERAQSSYRKQGIATEMMEMMMSKCPGQHIYLQTDDAIQFYRDLGFNDQPLGMSIVIGEYLQNDTRN